MSKQRKNKHITDLKYETKRRLDSLERKAREIMYQWYGIDFVIEQEFEELIGKINEIREEVAGIDTKTH